MTSASWIACYDISDDRERSHVEKILTGHGLRVQYSVFELRISKARKQKLDAQLKALDLQTGHVRLYRRLAGAATEYFGSVPPDPELDPAWIV